MLYTSTVATNDQVDVERHHDNLLTINEKANIITDEEAIATAPLTVSTIIQDLTHKYTLSTRLLPHVDDIRRLRYISWNEAI